MCDYWIKVNRKWTDFGGRLSIFGYNQNNTALVVSVVKFWMLDINSYFLSFSVSSVLQDERYLKPFLDEVEREMAEKQEWNKR